MEGLLSTGPTPSSFKCKEAKEGGGGDRWGCQKWGKISISEDYLFHQSDVEFLFRKTDEIQFLFLIKKKI